MIDSAEVLQNRYSLLRQEHNLDVNSVIIRGVSLTFQGNLEKNQVTNKVTDYIFVFMQDITSRDSAELVINALQGFAP